LEYQEKFNKVLIIQDKVNPSIIEGDGNIYKIANSSNTESKNKAHMNKGALNQSKMPKGATTSKKKKQVTEMREKYNSQRHLQEKDENLNK
jgi:hypothetical protein